MGKLTDRLDRPIVLVGLMGAGKSTVGRRLAKRLGLPFIDTDAAIADAAGFSAAEVFERYGEEDFRDGERRLVARLVDGEVRVIATGGGAFVDPRTRKLLNERAITVWLDAPVDVLADRTARRDTRPLLRNGDPKGTLERLAKDRGPYAEAHIRVTSGDGAHDDVVESIISAVDAHLDGRSKPLGRVVRLVGQRPVDPEAAVELRHAGRRSPSAPRAVRGRARDIRARPARPRGGHAQLHQRLAAHDHGAFVKLALADREIEPVELDHLQPVVDPGHDRGLRKRLEHRLQLVAGQFLRVLAEQMPSAVSAPAVRSRSIRVPSP